MMFLGVDVNSTPPKLLLFCNGRVYNSRAGQKAGYLGGAYFLGNFIGSLLWGRISDNWGRRPVLLCGVCGVIVSELLFGFSQNFGWAVGARLMWGLLNGNLGVAKAYISEVRGAVYV